MKPRQILPAVRVGAYLLLPFMPLALGVRLTRVLHTVSIERPQVRLQPNSQEHEIGARQVYRPPVVYRDATGWRAAD